jgi:heme/copper-type cytochrome/quinol oxidase subunit 2
MGSITDAVTGLGEVQLNIQYYMGIAIMVLAAVGLVYFTFIYKDKSDDIDYNGKEVPLESSTGVTISFVLGFIGFITFIVANFGRKNKSYQLLEGTDTIASGLANAISGNNYN